MPFFSFLLFYDWGKAEFSGLDRSQVLLLSLWVKDIMEILEDLNSNRSVPVCIPHVHREPKWLWQAARQCLQLICWPEVLKSHYTGSTGKMSTGMTHTNGSWYEALSPARLCVEPRHSHFLPSSILPWPNPGLSLLALTGAGQNMFFFSSLFPSFTLWKMLTFQQRAENPNSEYFPLENAGGKGGE